MHNSALRILMRFHGHKKTISHQNDSWLHGVGSIVKRHKIQLAMLDEEKVIDVEKVHTDTNSLSWLHEVAPSFPVNGSKITIIHEPSTFYNTLLEKCKSAKERITFASLYLGTGKLESELVKTIEQTMNTNERKVKVKILLDYMRGSRGKDNSCKMLEPLLKGTSGNNCQVFLYHTPKLRGLLKLIIPNRFNELIGLQHMKLYLIDNTLIISGANLSNDYFTNRQDRYFVINDCKDLCDFYDNLVSEVGTFSFLLQSDGTKTFNPANKTHPFLGSNKEFIEQANDKVQKLFKTEMNKRKKLDSQEKVLQSDTWIFPLVQMGQLGVCHDSEVTLRLLETAPAGATLRLATGYFNLTSEYSAAVLKYCQAACHLLTAHPTANGFFKAKGVASGIPAAYTKIEKAFFTQCEKLRQNNRVVLWEFTKPGWTYHAKGLWYSLPGEQKPSLTLIGSPNFGYRSVKRDLETQVVIVTKNENLQKELDIEYKQLFSCAKPVTKSTFNQSDRVPPAWVSAAVLLFRYFF